MDWYDTPEPLAERQEDHAQSTGQLSVYDDENWEQLRVDHRAVEERGHARWIVVDNAFNQRWYPDIIGREYSTPPSYAAVRPVE